MGTRSDGNRVDSFGMDAVYFDEQQSRQHHGDNIYPGPTPTTNKSDGSVEPMWTYQGQISYFLNISSVHGVPHVFRSPSALARVFWLFAFLGCLGVFCYQGTKTVQEYISYPYSTKVDIVTQTTLEFPAVTICNVNMMKRSRLIDTRFEGILLLDGGLTGDTDDYSWWFPDSFYAGLRSSTQDPPSENITSSPAPDVGRRKRSITVRDLAEMQKQNPHRRRRKRQAVSTSSGSLEREFDFFQSSWDQGSFDFDFYDYGFNDVAGESDWDGFIRQDTSPDFSDFRRAVNPTAEELRDYGHQPQDFILQCSFDRRNCDYRNFTMFQHGSYGNCFTFNGWTPSSNSTLKTGRTGAQYGLHLTLFIEQPEFVGLFTTESGVKVNIHQPGEIPFPEDDGVTVPTGQRTTISLRELNITRLGGNYGDPCTRTGDATNFTSDTYSYSRNACLKQCLQLTLLASCNCVTDIRFSNHSQCSSVNATQEKCRQLVEYLYDRNTLVCTCPIPCNEVSFSRSVSSSLWPSERYEEHLAAQLSAINNKTERILQDVNLTRKNVLNLVIYFEQLNYELNQQIAVYSFESLMGSLGGIMGLYLGMSFMSIGEMLLLLVGLCKIFGGKRFAPQSSPQITPSKTPDTSDADKAGDTSKRSTANRDQTLNRCMMVIAIISLQILIGLVVFLIVVIDRNLITINV